MSSKQFVLIALSSLVGAGVLFARDDDPSASTSEQLPTTAELLRKIEKLEQRIAVLEKELQQRPLRLNTPGVPVPPQAMPWVPRPDGQPDTQPLPQPNFTEPRDYWHKGHINGRPFYILPVGQSQVSQPAASSGKPSGP